MTINRKFLGLALVTACLAVGGHFIEWPFKSIGQAIAVLRDRDALIQFFLQPTDLPPGSLETAQPSALSVGLFILAHIVANAIGVPGTVLVVVGGALYGLWWGTAYSLIGATLGAIAAFWLARYWLHTWFQKRFAHRPLLQKLNHIIGRQGLGCVLLIRFSPISPFNLVNFALGLTPVPAGVYALGTLIGIIPGTLAYTWLGVTGTQALGKGNWVPLFGCLLLLMLLSAIPLWIQRRSIQH